MSTKYEELERGDSLWNKLRIDSDEPIFILRGRDALAPELVTNWANALEAHAGCGTFEQREARQKKVDGAHACAEAMREWQRINGMKIPD